MNNKGRGFVKFNLAVSALLTTVLLISVGAWAKDRKLKGSDDQANVVAHISLAELSAVDMAMQGKGNDKLCLYVQHSQFQGILIIDISKPAEPKALGVIPWPDPALSSRVNVVGNLAIVTPTAILPMRSSTSNDNLVLLDLSNPAAPRVVQEFSGVIKWLQDDRNFIYVLNDEGLWLVSKPADRQPEQTDYSNNYGG